MAESLPLPKYHRVYLLLREQLADGRYAAGVPGELHLMKSFGVARVTVRRALERLASEGLIARAAGRRTVALPAPGSRSRSAAGAAAARREPLPGLLENIVDMGRRTMVKVMQCDVVPASDAVARQLGLAPGARVQKAVRVRSSREGPLSVITTHVPHEFAQGFGRRELARKPILTLLEESGLRIGQARQTISAELADLTVAQWLDVPVGSALLSVRRLVCDVDDRPVQWLHGVYRPDRYQYEMALSRVGAIDAKVWVSHALPAPFH
jgi:GntR family transcriptional regulator